MNSFRFLSIIVTGEVLSYSEESNQKAGMFGKHRSPAKELCRFTLQEKETNREDELLTSNSLKASKQKTY